jgi:sugar/nucleoside kinase (ribokinase family)
MLNLDGCRALHVDGHQGDAALYYAKACREAGVLTSLDGGAVRDNSDELLAFIDVAIISVRMCEQMKLSPTAALQMLKAKGCRIGGVTMGERGKVETMPALSVPADKVIDTNGAGDVFHGAYVYSYLSAPDAKWERHFRFARAASAHKIGFLGNEAGLPALADVLATARTYGDKLD